LTGLLSRLGLEAALRKAAMQAENQGNRVALLVIGLDGFKSVNDSFGHALGDTVLREIGRRLVEHAGSLVTPPASSTSASHGWAATSFVLMLQGHLDRQALGRAAAKLLEVLDGPIDCDSHGAAFVGIHRRRMLSGRRRRVQADRARNAQCRPPRRGRIDLHELRAAHADDARDKHELLRDPAPCRRQQNSSNSSTSRRSMRAAGKVTARRGASALASPGARHAESRRVHPARGTARAHRGLGKTG